MSQPSVLPYTAVTGAMAPSSVRMPGGPTSPPCRMWSTSRKASKTSGRSRPWVSEITPRRMETWRLLRERAEGGEDLGRSERAVPEALHVAAHEELASALGRYLVGIEWLMEEWDDRISGGVNDRDRRRGIAASL